MNLLNNSRQNTEKPIVCPVEGCSAESVAREMHLHVLWSDGNGHGELGEIPAEVQLEEPAEAGGQESENTRLTKREIGRVARLCPYCERPFTGERSVLNHLEQAADQQDHPSNAVQVHESGDFPVVQLDEGGNVVGVVDNRLEAFRERLPDEQESEEPAVFAKFSKEQVDYLSKVIYSETDDERARLILERPYVESL